MTTTTAGDQLAALLRQERGSAEALLEVLEQEHAALTGNDADLIVAISRQKQQLTGQLQQQMSTRDRWLAQLGLPTGGTGIQQLTGGDNNDTPLAAEWRSLQQVAAELQRHNDINGGIVALNRNHVRQALDLLIGQQEATSAYDRDGNRSSRMSRTLARA